MSPGLEVRKCNTNGLTITAAFPTPQASREQARCTLPLQRKQLVSEDLFGNTQILGGSGVTVRKVAPVYSNRAYIEHMGEGMLRTSECRSRYGRRRELLHRRRFDALQCRRHRTASGTSRPCDAPAPTAPDRKNAPACAAPRPSRRRAWCGIGSRPPLLAKPLVRRGEPARSAWSDFGGLLSFTAAARPRLIPPMDLILRSREMGLTSAPGSASRHRAFPSKAGGGK